MLFFLFFWYFFCSMPFGNHALFNAKVTYNRLDGNWCVWPLKDCISSTMLEFLFNLNCSLFLSKKVFLDANDRASSTVIRMKGKENLSPIAWLAKWMTNDVSGDSKLIFESQGKSTMSSRIYAHQNEFRMLTIILNWCSTKM